MEAIVSVASVGRQAKIDAAKEYLGPTWVHHPEYQFNPRHSNDPHIYVAARQPYLQAIRLAAFPHL